MLGCCCLDPLLCGCCVLNGTTGAYECVDTGLYGAEGEAYCTDTLMGTPLYGVGYDRAYRCQPCDYESPGTVTQVTCPHPVNQGCEGLCSDADSAPPTMLLRISGPYNEVVDDITCPAFIHDCDCYLAQYQDCIDKIKAGLSAGVLVSQVTDYDPVDSRYEFDCAYIGVNSYYFPENVECGDNENGCQIIVSATVELNACGPKYELNADLSGTSSACSGVACDFGVCSSPCSSLNYQLRWGSGWDNDTDPCAIPGDCLTDTSDGSMVSYNDPGDIFSGEPVGEVT